jgi:hypothetical protein
MGINIDFLYRKTKGFYKELIKFMYIFLMPEVKEDLKLRTSFLPSAEGIPLSPNVTAARAIGQTDRFSEFTPQEARGIYIRGYGVTSADDAKPVLGTKGMGPCVGVAIYNPKTKVGTLAHFDTNTETSSLKKMIDAVRGQYGVLEVHLAGGELGSPHSQRLVEEIISRLSEESNLVIKSADILNSAGGLKALALDTRTGQVSNSFMGNHLDNGDRQNIMAFHASRALSREPLRPEYLSGTSFSVSDWQAEEQKRSLSLPQNSPKQ